MVAPSVDVVALIGKLSEEEGLEAHVQELNDRPRFEITAV